MQGQEEIDYSQKLDISLWKKLLHIAKPYHKHLWGVMVAMAVCAVGDVVFPRLTGYAIDHFIANKTTEGLGGFIAIYLVTSVISGIVFAGIVVWYLYRAIARTGALDKFASGREVRATA